MLKGILMSLILIACAGAGRLLSNARKRRTEALSEVLTAMRVLRLRMMNSMETLGILLRKSDSVVFKAVGNALWEGEGLNECWRHVRDAAVRRGGALDSLTDADMALLDDFFSKLGNSGRDEQGRLFSESIAALEDAQTHARDKYREAQRLYTSLGALIGAGVCILIA